MRVGGEYGGGGRYAEIDPPRRLAFTWLWDHEETRMLAEVPAEGRGLSLHSWSKLGRLRGVRCPTPCTPASPSASSRSSSSWRSGG
ncbi:SRPBCC domain-containing protein [Baekduia sp.]|uniref:SRPBCC domain-containing protein n=1 Tax=Baekduia sp. TaxID=2600305 RepID=UPI0039C88C35